MRRSLTTALLVFSLGLTWSGGRAWAEERTPEQEARERFGRGVELYREGRYEAALAEFVRAYEIAPHFSVLYNIGQMQHLLDRSPEALATLERYLEQGGERIPAERRAEVEATIERLRQVIGFVRITVEGPGEATVLIDGVEAARTPLDEPLAVNAGRHQVELRAEGYLPLSRAITVAGGAEVALRVALDPVPSAPGALLVLSPLAAVTVSVDGRERGTTPLDEAIALPAGEHLVELSRPGYRAESVRVTIDAGEVTRLERTLEPASPLPAEVSGELALDVRGPGPGEAGATRVLLDGAPLPPGPVPAGPHRLEVSHPDFQAWSEDIEVVAGGTQRIEVVLVPSEAFRARAESRSRRLRLAGWITSGLAVAILGTTLGLYLWNRGRDANVEEELDQLEPQLRSCPPPGVSAVCDDRWDQWNSANERSEELASWGDAEWALLGLGAASLVAGVVLLITGYTADRPARVALAPSPGGFILRLGPTGRAP